MGQAEVLIAGLLVAVAGLASLARVLPIPCPIVLVIGGTLLGFIPGLPAIVLDPEVVLVVFLPPLLCWAAFSANFSDLRTLALNSVALVLVTLCGVAVIAHAPIRSLRLAGADAEADEELRARLEATGAALARIEDLAEQEWARDEGEISSEVMSRAVREFDLEEPRLEI